MANMSSNCDFCANETSFNFKCHSTCDYCVQQLTHDKLLAFFYKLSSNPQEANGIFDGRCPQGCKNSSSMPFPFLKQVVDNLRQYGPADVFLYFDAFQSYFEGKYTFFWECSNCQKINSASQSFSGNCWHCDLRYEVPEPLKKMKKAHDLNARKNYKFPSIKKQSTRKQTRNKSSEFKSRKNSGKSINPEQINKKDLEIDQSAALVLDDSRSYIESFEIYIEHITQSPNVRVIELIAFTDDDDSYFYDKFLQTHHYLVKIPNSRKKATHLKLIRSFTTAIGVIELPAQPSDLLENGIEITSSHINCPNPSNYLLKFSLTIISS